MSSYHSTSFVALSIVTLVSGLTLAGCNNGVRRRTGTETDGGTVATLDSGLPPLNGDGGTAFDGGRTGVDGGRTGIDDGGTSFDGGRTGIDDGGRTSFDGGRTGIDGGGTGFDGGWLPSLDGGTVPFCTMPSDCPSGQMCCELLPGTGLGTCAVSCP